VSPPFIAVKLQAALAAATSNTNANNATLIRITATPRRPPVHYERENRANNQANHRHISKQNRHNREINHNRRYERGTRNIIKQVSENNAPQREKRHHKQVQHEKERVRPNEIRGDNRRDIQQEIEHDDNVIETVQRRRNRRGRRRNQRGINPRVRNRDNRDLSRERRVELKPNVRSEQND
jgi:hypothetical protein